MKYVLNNKVFKRQLIEKGYTSLLEFSRATHIHRNTIKNYLSGRDVFSSAFFDIAKHLEMSPLELIMPISDSDLRIANIDELKPVIAKIVSKDEDVAVLLMGSRAKGNLKKYSDWDIGITRTPNPITSKEYLRLKQLVLDAADDLPRNVDLINLDAAPFWFISKINYDPLFLDGNGESYSYFKGVLNGIKRRQ